MTDEKDSAATKMASAGIDQLVGQVDAIGEAAEVALTQLKGAVLDTVTVGTKAADDISNIGLESLSELRKAYTQRLGEVAKALVGVVPGL